MPSAIFFIIIEEIKFEVRNICDFIFREGERKFVFIKEPK